TLAVRFREASPFTARRRSLDVVNTVFFAVTVTYILIPLHERLVRRGIPSWWASLVSTVVGFVSILILIGYAAFLVYLRRAEIVEAVTGFPSTTTVEAVGFTYTVDVTDLRNTFIAYLTQLAVELARRTPVLALKLTLFSLLIFSLTHNRHRVSDAVWRAVPAKYQDITRLVEGKVESTLFSLYVLQASVSAVTFVLSFVVFSFFGYDYSGTLAAISGLLQFFPIVGPSVLIAGIVVYELLVGSLVKAMTVGIVGGIVIAWLPDAVIRVHLADERLPGSLYFIGFTGGLLSIGPIGVIAGPIVVVLIAEMVKQLADSNDRTTTST
ncbi:MAG: AI-2E family transporter, partial [Halobacteria archaeon]|nr:AI-2E family transporter [Halobacteria archaeon]